MSAPRKRILLVQEDLLVSQFYEEALEHLGFTAQTARSGTEALDTQRTTPADVVIIDPMIAAPDAGHVIRHWRADPATAALPIIALPTSRLPLAEAVLASGATRLVARALNPPAELLDTLQSVLGQPRTATATRGLPFQPGPTWLNLSHRASADALIAMRHWLHAAMKDQPGPDPIRQLLHQVHGLNEQMALFGQRPLFHFLAAMEALLFDLHRFPEQVNASNLRTISQAIDFLAQLLTPEHRPRLADPSHAQVLVVDDEPGACQIILAAMSLVHLRASAAETPSAALAALAAQPFHLIFLDIGLPEMDGFDLCARARTIPQHEKTPIVFLTGMATFQNRVQSSLSGGNDFVGKPFSLPELGLKALTWVFRGQLGLG